jgi:PhoH-like ATPase
MMGKPNKAISKGDFAKRNPRPAKKVNNGQATRPINVTRDSKPVNNLLAAGDALQTKINPRKETKKSVKHICVLDTNVLINDWKALKIFIKDENMTVLPATVIKELDKLKRVDRTKREAQKALREIDRLQTEGNPFLVIETGMIFTRLNLDKTNPDHQIIATLNYVLYHSSREGSKYYGYDNVKMITDDHTVKILAREVKQKTELLVEPYFNNRIKIDDKDLDIPIRFVNDNSIKREGRDIFFPAKGNLRRIPDGAPIIGYSDVDCKKVGEFCAVRQDNKFIILDPDIQAFGVSRLDLVIDHHKKTNWGQVIALYYLMNPKVTCVFMQGATGSGKTLLAMAAGMELKEKGFYPKIVVYRIPESAYGDSSPALPGDVGQKIAPWTEPIIQALYTLLKINEHSAEREKFSEDNGSGEKSKNGKRRQKKSNGNGNNANGNVKPKPAPSFSTQSALKVFVDAKFEENNVEIKVLDYVRGITLDDAFIIIDDAQNLNKKNIKDIITRDGKNAKIVFTGDLNQIDNKYIDKETSGFSHAIVKLKHLACIGVVNLSMTVRGVLAAAADKLL